MKYIHTANCRGGQGGICHCRKDRGYTVQRELKPGDLVTLFDDFTASYYDAELKRHTLTMRGGDVAKIESFSNMGFNGIVVTLTFQGKRLYHIEAGKIIKADNGESYRRAVMEEYDRRIRAAQAAIRHAQEWANEYGLPEEAIADVNR